MPVSCIGLQHSSNLEEVEEKQRTDMGKLLNSLPFLEIIYLLVTTDNILSTQDLAFFPYYCMSFGILGKTGSKMWMCKTHCSKQLSEANYERLSRRILLNIFSAPLCPLYSVECIKPWFSFLQGCTNAVFALKAPLKFQLVDLLWVMCSLSIKSPERVWRGYRPPHKHHLFSVGISGWAKLQANNECSCYFTQPPL